MQRITEKHLLHAINRVNYALRKTDKCVITGGDIAGTIIYLADRKDHKKHGGVDRTLLYGATKSEALSYLEGFLDIVGYSNARVLKEIKR